MSVNDPKTEASKTLIVAASEGDLKAIMELVPGIADVDYNGANNPKEDRITALLIAAERGYLDIVKYLLEQGKANPLISLAFHLGEVEGNPRIVRNLLLCAAQSNNATLLNYLFDYLNLNFPKQLKEMLQEGYENGEKFIDYAMGTRNAPLVKKILRNFPEHAPPNFAGFNLLHQAITYGDFELAKYLIDQFPFLLYQKDEKGWTPFQMAAVTGFDQIIEYILNNDKIRNRSFIYDPKIAVDNFGFYPIHYAAVAGHTSTIKLILKHCPECVRQLIAHSNTNILQIAAIYNKAETVKYILNNLLKDLEEIFRLDLLYNRVHLMVLLKLAEQNSSFDAIAVILEKFPDEKPRFFSNSNNMRMIEYFLKKGEYIELFFDPESMYFPGRKAFMESYEYLKKSIFENPLSESTIRLIQNSGPNLNARIMDWDGDTLLHRAILENNKELAYTLLMAGVSPEIPNNAGKTPLQLAKNEPFFRELFELAKIKQLKDEWIQAQMNRSPTPLQEDEAAEISMQAAGADQFALVPFRQMEMDVKRRGEIRIMPDMSEPKVISETTYLTETKDLSETKLLHELKANHEASHIQDNLAQRLDAAFAGVKGLEQQISDLPSATQDGIHFLLGSALAPLDSEGHQLPPINAVAAYNHLKKISKKSPHFKEANKIMHNLLMGHIDLVPAQEPKKSEELKKTEESTKFGTIRGLDEEEIEGLEEEEAFASGYEAEPVVETASLEPQSPIAVLKKKPSDNPAFQQQESPQALEQASPQALEQNPKKASQNETIRLLTIENSIVAIINAGLEQETDPKGANILHYLIGSYVHGEKNLNNVTTGAKINKKKIDLGNINAGANIYKKMIQLGIENNPLALIDSLKQQLELRKQHEELLELRALLKPQELEGQAESKSSSDRIEASRQAGRLQRNLPAQGSTQPGSSQQSLSQPGQPQQGPTPETVQSTHTPKPHKPKPPTRV